MAYFNRNFVSFFKDLSINNNRDWFNENKSRFKEDVEEPFYHFVDELITRIRDDDPQIQITPKEAVFRIYRDVRFSKDKSPYKIHVSAVISPGGRKDFVMAGHYLEMNHKGLGLYGGLYSVGPTELNNLRHYIANNLTEFKKLRRDKKFQEKFGEVLGEANKRIPKEFDEIFQKEPLIANKQFYFYHKFPQKLILSGDLSDTIIEYYKVSKPLTKFLREGVLFENY